MADRQPHDSQEPALGVPERLATRSRRQDRAVGRGEKRSSI